MARLVIIVFVITTFFIGSEKYKHYQTDGAENHSVNSSSNHSSMSKCITHSGETYYGMVPEGVVCERSETIDLSIKSNVLPQSNILSKQNVSSKSKVFKCDGRRHCAQMTSCAEAKFFIKNCPETKMDGDGDNIPCEGQWCN